MNAIKPLSPLTPVTGVENTKIRTNEQAKEKDYLKLSCKKLLPNLSKSQSKIKQIKTTRSQNLTNSNQTQDPNQETNPNLHPNTNKAHDFEQN